MLRSRRRNDETVFNKDQFEILEKLRKAKSSYDIVEEEYDDVLSKKKNADGNLTKEACNEILDWIRNHSKKSKISMSTVPGLEGADNATDKEGQRSQTGLSATKRSRLERDHSEEEIRQKPAINRPIKQLRSELSTQKREHQASDPGVKIREGPSSDRPNKKSRPEPPASKRERQDSDLEVQIREAPSISHPSKRSRPEQSKQPNQHTEASLSQGAMQEGTKLTKNPFSKFASEKSIFSSFGNSDTRGERARSPRVALQQQPAYDGSVTREDQEESLVDQNTKGHLPQSRQRFQSHVDSGDESEETQQKMQTRRPAGLSSRQQPVPNESSQVERGMGTKNVQSLVSMTSSGDAQPRLLDDHNLEKILKMFPPRLPTGEELQNTASSQAVEKMHYLDLVTGKEVDALIIGLTPRGQLLVAFQGRNPAFPKYQAGALVPASECRQEKAAWIASRGSSPLKYRSADSFSGKKFSEFDLLLVASAPDRGSENKTRVNYPVTVILGKFRDEKFITIVLRSTFNWVYGQRKTELMYARHRDREGTPQPQAAILKGLVPDFASTLPFGASELLPSTEDIRQAKPAAYQSRTPSAGRGFARTVSRSPEPDQEMSDIESDSSIHQQSKGGWTPRSGTTAATSPSQTPERILAAKASKSPMTGSSRTSPKRPGRGVRYDLEASASDTGGD